MSLHSRPVMSTQARVQGGGGPRGLPPPLEIEKQKKKVIRANFKLFHLYFATFLVENVIFFIYFLSCPPPPEKLKSKKKGFQILPSPLRIPGHAPATSLGMENNKKL